MFKNNNNLNNFITFLTFTLKSKGNWHSIWLKSNLKPVQ